MDSSTIIYCDESGNDGPNYLNEASPFYVLAGWVTPEHAIVDATVEMERLRQSHCRDAEELKFKTFKKKPWAVCNSMTRLGKMGLVPLYLLAEKRYCVAGKIVETFLDPYYNGRLTAPFTSDIPTKKELANTFYERLDSETIRIFARAYRDPTHQGLERALVHVADDCRRCINPELAHLIEGSLLKLDEIAHDEVTAVTSWGKAMGTINLPCLISFLMILEELGRQRNIHPKKIVHDEQGPYQDDYHKLFEQFQQADDDKRILISGMKVPHGAIRMIDEFEFQKSVEQPLVQAADLLAGSVAHLATGLIRDRELTDDEIKLGALLFPTLLLDDVSLAMTICSNQMLGRVGDALARAYPSTAEDTTTLESRKGHSVRWTSSLPAGEHLPVLPPKRHEDERVIEPHFSVKITLPLYGIANNSENQLVIFLPPDKTYHQCEESEIYLPLWTRRESAESILDELHWTEPHHLVEFGPKEVPDLVEHLRRQSQWTRYVGFNLFEDDMAPIPIEELVNDIDRLWDRCIRAGKSGMLPAVFRNETIGEHDIGSVLLSNGNYGAMKMPDGPIVQASTREEAVAKLAAELD